MVQIGNPTTKSSRLRLSGNLLSLGVLLLLVGALVGYWIGAITSKELSSNTTSSSSLLRSVDLLEKAPYSSNNNNNNDKGWKEIHVFYGDTKHLKVASQLAQAQQDTIVAALLQNKQSGYFVDLAAHEATYISNTYMLERDLDWNGLCIEANPAYWRELTYRKCDVVAAVVGATHMEEIEFQFHKDGALGGIVGSDFGNKPNAHAPNLPVKYYTVTFRDVLERMNAPRIMDYLSLDVEGAEYFVMQNFPFDAYQFRIMTIERPSQQLKRLLEKNGYEQLCDLGHFGETLWVSRQEKSSLDLSAPALPEDCRAG